MRAFLLFIAFFGALILSGTWISTTASADSTVTKQAAVTHFAAPVTLLNQTLKGDYLFIHDDEAMARGDACTYVYKGVAEIPRNLVVSFHCTHAKRARVAYFTVRTSLIPPHDYEIQEFQFAGSTDAHVVPVYRVAEIPLVALF